MRAMFCVAALFSLLAPCTAKTSAEAHPLTIVYRFDGDPSALAFRELQSEVRLLLQSSSITPQWRDRRSIRSRETFENLVVVSFHGRCNAASGSQASTNESVLGHSQVTDGQVLPFIEIECERVGAFLHAATMTGRSPDGNAALGRALARVLAHELYHVLAGTISHAATGIAKPSLSNSDLVSAGLGLAPAELDRMKPWDGNPSAPQFGKSAIR